MCNKLHIRKEPEHLVCKPALRFSRTFPGPEESVCFLGGSDAADNRQLSDYYTLPVCSHH